MSWCDHPLSVHGRDTATEDNIAYLLPAQRFAREPPRGCAKCTLVQRYWQMQMHITFTPATTQHYIKARRRQGVRQLWRSAHPPMNEVEDKPDLSHQMVFREALVNQVAVIPSQLYMRQQLGVECAQCVQRVYALIAFKH